MLIRYSCKDMGLNCSFVYKGVTLEEVSRRALEHVRAEHAKDFNVLDDPYKVEQMRQALARSTRVVPDGQIAPIVSPGQSGVSTFHYDYPDVFGNIIADIKRRSYALMHIYTGNKVLDVGCGRAADTIPLAELVGMYGHVEGLDPDPAMISAADQRAADANLSGRITHTRGDVEFIPFSNDTFDSCRCERVFEWLPASEASPAEMWRVTKEGGWAVGLEADWGSLSFDIEDEDLERRVVDFNATVRLPNGYAGRQLNRLYKEWHFSDISVELFPVCITSYADARQVVELDDVEYKMQEVKLITQDELKRWHDALEQADAKNVFFAHLTLVLAAGKVVKKGR